MANRRFIDFPIAASVGDNDIVLIWQDGLNKQTTKATLFAGSPNSLAGLTDVDISALANGQILQYNSTTSKWENVDRTDIDLDQLGDVTIVSPTNGQVLVYNSSTSKWENSSAGFVPYTGAVTTVNLGAQSILAGSFVKAGGTSAQFLKADGSVDSNTYLTTGNAAATYVPYTGATADVNLGTHDLTAERGTFQNNGSSDTLTVNHTSGSGYGIKVTKGGNNEALYVSKTSGSGNAMTVVGGRTSLVDLALSSVSNTAGDFLTLSGGVVHKRTAAEVRTDIGAGTVISVAALTLGTTGTDLSSTVANGTTTPVITLNVPTASASNRGALSSADWTTFNNKQNALTNPVTGTGSAGQVAYFTGTTTISSESNLFWDATNDRLGIGTNTFGEKLSVYGVSGGDSFGFFSGGTGTTLAGIKMGNGGNTYGSLYFDNGSNDVSLFQQYISGNLRFGTNSIVKMILTQNGRLLIGNAPPTESTFALDVNGTGQFSGSVTASSFIKSGGTSSQFLKADGSVDSTTYVPIGRTITINGTTQDLSANRTFNVGTVTSVTASSPLFSSGGATPNITIQQASGSQSGFLSSTDWTTFNNKQNALTNPVTGTGSINVLPKFTDASTIGNSQIIDDGTSVSIGGTSENGFLNIRGVDQNLNIYCVTSVGPNWSANLFLKGGSLTSVQALYLGYGSNYYDVYIKRNIDGRLSLGTNQNDRLSIFNQGNVFIGGPTITDAGYKLDVNGTGRFSSSGSTNLVVERTGSNGSFIGLKDGSGNFNYLGTNNGNFLIENNSGGELLQIASTGAATFSSSVNIGASATTGKQLIVNQTGASGYFLSGEASGTEIGYWYYDASQIQFSSKSATRALTFLTSDVTRLTIASTGAATFSSSVTATNGNFSGLTRITGVTGVPSTGQGLELYYNSTTGLASVGSYDRGAGVQKSLEFQGLTISLKTGGSERMLITSGGNVGIGTASVTTGKLVVKSGESNSTGIVLERGDNTDKLVNIFSTTADGKIAIASGGATKIFLDSVGASYFTGGNVLIGTQTTIGPAAGRVDILYSGLVQYGMNIRSSHTDGIAISFVNSSGSQVGTIYQNSSSTAYNTSSDYRLKTDLKEFNGVEIINKIKTYDFEWKTDKTRSYGVIAHELKEVIDYAVFGEKDSVTMQGVDYSKLVPIMVKAIQEQQQEIIELKNKLS
jgi:hypothetical protein